MYDEHQLTAFNSQFCCAVLGKGDDFMLIQLNAPDDVIDAECENAARLSYCYCGIMAVIDGQPRAKCADAAGIITMVHASTAFARLVAARMKPKRPSSDWPDFMARLWSLEDPRE